MKMVKENHRSCYQMDLVPRLECDVKAITDRGTDTTYLLTNVVKGMPVTGDINSVFGIIRERHPQMTIGYNTAAPPDWDAVPLTIVLSYHQWVKQRGTDAGTQKRLHKSYFRLISWCAPVRCQVGNSMGLVRFQWI